LAVIVVSTYVAACSLAWTPAWISAFQSMLEMLVEPPVFEAVEDDVDPDEAVVVAEDEFVALLTVIIGPFGRTTGQCVAGPSLCGSIQEHQAD
jgi:hypothetical protein